MKESKKKHQGDECEALIGRKTISYNNVGHGQRQSSRLDWAESSWIRWLHVLCWWWINPILSLGYKRSLTDNDLDDLSYNDKSSVLLSKVHLYDWTKTTTWRIVVLIIWKEFTLVGLFLFPCMATRIAQPLLLRQIILHIENEQESLIGTYFYAVLLFVCAVVQSFFQQQLVFRSVRIGLKVRSSLISIIYRHVLSIKIASLQQMNTAQIINLIAHDSTKFLEVFRFLHYVWSAPLEAIIVFPILCWIIGFLPVLFGYFVFLLFIPIQLFFSRKFSQYRVITTSWAEKRIHAFNEFIHGCRIIKMYNWEKMVENRISQIRQNEFASIQHASRLRAFNITQSFVSTPLLAFITFGSAWLLNYPLNTANIFTTLSFFALMQSTVGFFLLQAIQSLNEIPLTSKRIDTFMRLATMQGQHSISFMPSSNLQQKGRLVMYNASFSWNGDNPCLSSINITIEPGTFVGIVGPTGSGKSSLLAAILGEINLINGQLYTNGSSFSYAAQSPWIFADTLRNNILLNRPFDQQRYMNVVHACCLDVDLEIFGSRGDLIMIGEKGVNLSGGQKTRVSLARALYADADIYLLDDPLASVDRSVAIQIYERCFGLHGLLKDKTRLVVTHQTHFLTESQQTIFLVHGSIDEEGRLDENITKKDDEMTREKSILADILELNLSTVDAQPIIADETPVSGSVSWSLWCRLFTAPPLSWFGLCLLVAVLVIGEAFYDASNYWLSLLSKDFCTDQQHLCMGAYIYIGLVVGTVLADLVRTSYFFFVVLHGSNTLHNNMLRGLLHTSIRFFESNPSGRILNRISSDQQSIDELFPVAIFNSVASLLSIAGAVIIICFVSPYVLILFVPLVPILCFVSDFYLKSNRQIKRLESVTRSPIYAFFSSSLDGLTTIRAFEVKDDFIKLFTDRIDANTRAYILMQGSMQWFTLRVDLLSSLVMLITAILLVFLHDRIRSSAVALSLMYTIAMVGLLQWGIRQLIEAQILITSAERIDEYAQLPCEEDEDDEKRLLKMPPEWPSCGTIEFRNYSLRYRSGLESVLKDINICIKSGEKIGIIGRTGSGKSSIFNGLFRMVDQSCVNGEILIDDINISCMTLNHLRSHLSIIPQQPVLFSGTLRYNLDPFDHYSDEQCLMALEDVQLKHLVSNHAAGLLFPVAESGNNLSAGECQLICVARAILKKSKVLLIDEATANVDQKTDQILQAVISTKFKDQTVMTIAHRLNTIANSDRVLVLEKGMIINFDTPTNILHYYQ